ncbi:MAG: DUF1833 family protein [Patescibacteria group bacterium]
MPHTLTPTGVLTKNALTNPAAWLILIKIDATAAGGSTYRRTSDNSITVWAGEFYAPIAMSFGEVKESIQGDLPRVDMVLSNLDTEINTAMNAYDGLRGAAVTVYIVPSGNLAASTPELTEIFEVIETSADDRWVTLSLGFADPLGRRFPRDRYTASACRHVYNGHPTEGLGVFCRLSDTHPLYDTECDHTLTHCELRSNTAQFGGSPGVDEGIYR